MDNIEPIVQSKDCCGCLSCIQSCPRHCLSEIRDAEGFAYPQINEEECIHCGACVKHCPQANALAAKNQIFPKKVYAGFLKEAEMLRKSSSGGFFAGLASYVLDQGGVVFGCAFDDALVAKHIAVHSRDKLEMLQGSKYVATDINSCYSQAKAALAEGKTVLFSGSPCHIFGLKCFLGKEYENLITADLICHGTPSPKFFSAYIEWLGKKLKGRVRNFCFRDKAKYGWGIVGSAKTERRTKKIESVYDPYYTAFNGSMNFRPSCYNCHYANLDRPGDFTMGDFWGGKILFPEMDLSSGISTCILNTSRALSVFERIKDNFFIREITLSDAQIDNDNLKRPSIRPKARDSFYLDLDSLEFSEYMKKNISVRNYTADKIHESIYKNTPTFIWNFVKRVFACVRRD